MTSLQTRPGSAGSGEGGSCAPAFAARSFAATAGRRTASLAVNLRWTRSFPRTGGGLHACRHTRSSGQLCHELVLAGYFSSALRFCIVEAHARIRAALIPAAEAASFARSAARLSSLVMAARRVAAVALSTSLM